MKELNMRTGGRYIQVLYPCMCICVQGWVQAGTHQVPTRTRRPATSNAGVGLTSH